MKILIFGEVLWDVYPDKKVIGGAPLNFAGHTTHLGDEAVLVSAVGDDTLGKETLAAVKALNINDAMIATVPFPTGVCNVTIDQNGVPSYDLCRGVAYDNIPVTNRQIEDIREGGYDALYFGSLAQRDGAQWDGAQRDGAQRDGTSRETLKRILQEFEQRCVIFDVNIRQSYYTKEVLSDGLNACTILKFSREESGVFERLGLANVTGNDADCLRALCRDLAFRYDIGTVLLTLDKDGAMVFDRAADAFTLSERPTGRVISTVGAGDSFSAGYLHFALRGRPVKDCLERAVHISNYVVQHLESVPVYSQELLEKLA